MLRDSIKIDSDILPV